MPAPDYKLFQVIFDAEGEIESTTELPAEPEKKRVLLVRAETEHQAESIAEDLYSLAK